MLKMSHFLSPLNPFYLPSFFVGNSGWFYNNNNNNIYSITIIFVWTFYLPCLVISIIIITYYILEAI